MNLLDIVDISMNGKLIPAYWEMTENKWDRIMLPILLCMWITYSLWISRTNASTSF